MDSSGFSSVTESERGLIVGYKFTSFATAIIKARYHPKLRFFLPKVSRSNDLKSFST